MIKIRIAVLALALSVVSATFSFAANPHIGAWKLNEKKSKMPADMGKNTMVTYAEMKDKIKVSVQGVDKDGKPRNGVWVGKFDGKTYPSKGNLTWNAAAYKMVNDRSNQITTWKDGKLVWTGLITVSADGKSRTVTMDGTGTDGKKFKGKAFYDKQG
jgi:hypothetical protein